MNYFDNVPEDFKERFASWVRIEPRCRSNDIAQGLEARIADPLWMLSRQWQMGEFSGQDNGSPIRINVQYENTPMNEVTLNQSSTNFSLSNSIPLEAVVESEQMPMDWRNRIRIGQQFERFLRIKLPQYANQIIYRYRQDGYYPVVALAGTEVDYATQRYLKVMAGRAIDGGKLLQDIKNNAVPSLPDDINIQLNPAILTEAFSDLITWYNQLYFQVSPQHGSAWQQQQLQYRFNVDTNSSCRLIAPDYQNGDLDWYSFETQNDLPKTIGNTTTECFNPTRIGFPGKPNERWWTFEDRNVDFGGLDTATTDVIKLIMMEFALIHADDWYMVPLEVPIGTLTRITSLKIVNVFGEESPKVPLARNISSNPLACWQLFTPDLYQSAPQIGAGEFLIVPPLTTYREESSPLEEVRFIRDEGANMVFAIEHTVQNMLGNTVDGYEAQLERKAREMQTLPTAELSKKTDPSPDDIPRYRIASTVPDNWIPYLPVNAANSGLMNVGLHSIRLRQAWMLRNDDAVEPEEIIPMTSLLYRQDTAEKLTWLNEEAVPRTGVRVQLTKQRIRWVDGKTYVWLGRKVSIGRGEGSSGLHFDYLEYKK